MAVIGDVPLLAGEVAVPVVVVLLLSGHSPSSSSYSSSSLGCGLFEFTSAKTPAPGSLAGGVEFDGGVIGDMGMDGESPVPFEGEP